MRIHFPLLPRPFRAATLQGVKAIRNLKDSG